MAFFVRGQKTDLLGCEVLALGVVSGLLISYLHEGGLDGTPPSEGGMARACGASDVESSVGEALGLGLRVDGDATWAPFVLAMAEMERNCLVCVPQGACWVRRGASS